MTQTATPNVRRQPRRAKPEHAWMFNRNDDVPQELRFWTKKNTHHHGTRKRLECREGRKP